MSNSNTKTQRHKERKLNTVSRCLGERCLRQVQEVTVLLTCDTVSPCLKDFATLRLNVSSQIASSLLSGISKKNEIQLGFIIFALRTKSFLNGKRYYSI